MNIEFNNLKKEYFEIQKFIKPKLNYLFKKNDFINGIEINIFEDKLKKMLVSDHLISCGNGTDAILIAIMSLGLKRGDQVIMPAFAYISVIEVVCFLGLTPLLVDVDYNTFNINTELIERNINKKTKLIIPVHLFGQNSNMKAILKIAKKYNLYVIEDAAQSINCNYYFKKNKIKKSGTIGDLGCYSFFPTKNLGCYGDGGALVTNNLILSKKARMIKNHGQKTKYNHHIIGVNSRLDTIQAIILNSKLNILNKNTKKREINANFYDENLKNVKDIIIPRRVSFSDHVFHQYTIKVLRNKRNFLREKLKERGIPTIVYYPKSINQQKAYRNMFNSKKKFYVSEKLAKEVLSLPVHPYLNKRNLEFISKNIKDILND